MHLVAKHWLSVFLRRRQFSNQLRLYHNSLYFSGFRSLCAQAHIVNRLLSPLTGSSPTNSCFVELRSASKAECADSPKHTSDVKAADDCAVNLPPEDVSGLRANEWESTHMPGVYDPVMFLKAHALRLFETIISVLKSSFEVAEFTTDWRVRMHDSDSCSEIKLLVLELEEYIFSHLQRSQSDSKGLPRPNESAKRERETRRSSFSNELGSPISASKGEKRTPSHGVWSLASHRDNWRSTLSVANTCACVGFYLYILASKASGM